MLEGGIAPDDLVTIIGEQAITIRVLQQDKRTLQARVNQLEAEMQEATERAENRDDAI